MPDLPGGEELSAPWPSTGPGGRQPHAAYLTSGITDFGCEPAGHLTSVEAGTRVVDGSIACLPGGVVAYPQTGVVRERLRPCPSCPGGYDRIEQDPDESALAYGCSRYARQT